MTGYQDPVTISRACFIGLIGDSTSTHAQCQNRDCVCVCHTAELMFPKSRKAQRAMRVTTPDEEWT